MDLTISIVSFKSKDFVKKLLESIGDSKTHYSWEVILVDNDSRDGTVAMAEQDFLSQPEWRDKLSIIENANEGFGKAHNRAIKKARGEYVLILNPDCKLEPNTLEVLMDFLRSRPDVGIVTPKLLKGNGQMDLACRRSFPTPLSAIYRFLGLSLLFPKSKRFATYNLTYASDNEQMEIDACNGAFMLISPSCMKAVGGFDEAFFMYDEDIDLCLRAKQEGFKVWYYPGVTAVHYKGQSSKQVSTWMLYEFHKSKWIYYRKHFAREYNFIINGLMYIAIWARFLVKLIQNTLRREKFVSK